jgi:hypothetical protein
MDVQAENAERGIAKMRVLVKRPVVSHASQSPAEDQR